MTPEDAPPQLGVPHHPCHDICLTLRVASLLDRASFLISTSNKLRSDWKFLSGEAHSIARCLFVNAFDLVKNATRLHDCNPILGSAFAFAHASLSRLFCYRLVGKHSNPDLPATFDMTSHRNTGCLNLAIGYPRRLQTLEPIFTEADLTAASCDAVHATPHLLSVLNFFRHQHVVIPFPIAVFRLPILRTLAVEQIGNWQSEIGNLLLFFSPRPSTFRCAFALASSARPAFAFTDARFIDRIRAGTTGHRCFWIHDFAAINPNLHSDLAKRRLCLSQTIIDICAQSVQRQLSLKMPFATRDFSTIQSTTDLDFNPLRAKPQRLFDGFSHRPSKINTLLALGRNLLSLQLCIHFRPVSLMNRHEQFTPGLRREVTIELVDFGAFPTNDDAWSGRVDDYLETIGSSLDINVRNASACKTLLQVTFQLEVFQQKLAELLLGEPMRMPVFVVAKSKTVWTNFLTHNLLRLRSEI